MRSYAKAHNVYHRCLCFIFDQTTMAQGTGHYLSPGGGGEGGGEAKDLGLNKVRFILADPPYERYFTEVILSNNIWWPSRSPSPCLHFPSKFEWSPLWILPKFSVIPPLGFSVTTDPPSCSPKNQVIPPKILLFPPAPRTRINDRSPRTKISDTLALPWLRLFRPHSL